MLARTPTNSMVCPLTGCLFLNPVITSCGHTFEKAKVVSCDQCPTCETPLTEISTPNLAIQQSVAELLNADHEQWLKQYIVEFDCNFDTLYTNKEFEKIAEFYRAYPEKIPYFVRDFLGILHLAARDGNLALLTHMTSVPNLDWDIPRAASGTTPLHLAANAEVLQLLLNQGADPNIIGSNDLTPLLTAVKKGDNEKVIVLSGSLRIGASVNLLDADGNSAVFIAIKTCSALAVKSLCEVVGIDLDYKNGKGLTALHRAILEDDSEKLLTVLAYSGINICYYSPSPQVGKLTPLEFAVAANKPKSTAILSFYNLVLSFCNQGVQYPVDLSCLSQLSEEECKKVIAIFCGKARGEGIIKADFILGYVHARIHSAPTNVSEEQADIKRFLSTDIQVMDELFTFIENSNLKNKWDLLRELRRTSYSLFKAEFPDGGDAADAVVAVDAVIADAVIESHRLRLRELSSVRNHTIFYRSTGYLPGTSTGKDIDRQIKAENEWLAKHTKS